MLRLFVQSSDRLDIAACDLGGLPEKPVGAAWYDLLNPTEEEDRFVERSLGIDLPTREEMMDIEPSARLYKEAGAEFMTMTAMVNLDTDTPAKTPVTFILRENVLITVRHVDPKPFKLFVIRATKAGGRLRGGGEAVMVGLIEAFIDRLAQVLETASDEIDRISHEVFRARSGDKREPQDLQSVIERIGRRGELLTLARESLLSIIRVTSFHQAGEGKKAALKQDIKTLQRDATALADHAAYLSNKINFLLDATLGLINLEQNQIIKIFTVASVAFLPPTLVASIYGMNFAAMPELTWEFGYPFAIAIMVASAIVPFIYFKRRGWL